MKRYVFLMTFSLISLTGMSQTMTIHRTDGTLFTIWSDSIRNAKFFPTNFGIVTKDDEDLGCEYVDLDCITFSTKEESPVYFLPEKEYTSTDFSKDGQITVLQKHERGKGIPLVILGDAFSDRMINLGFFDKYAKAAMEAFFAREPFTTFRDYFDVYSVTVVSPKEVTSEETTFGLGLDNSFTEAGDQKLQDYVLSISELNGSLKDVTAIMISNMSPEFSGSYHSWLGEDNFNVAQTTLTLRKNYFAFNDYLVWHECGGHCFGLLADERVNNDASEVYPDEDHQYLDEQHSEGGSFNIDYHDAPETIWWKDFIANPDYQVEQIGLYEGALYSFAKSIYRPSDTSIMYASGEKSYYNAPSRWAIYQRIMKLAGEEYKFEDFLEYDKKNLEAIKALNAQSRSASTRTSVSQKSQINCRVVRK